TEAGADHLAIARHVEAHALVGVLLAALDPRLPCRRMHRLLPDSRRRLVTAGALGVADVIGAPRLARRGRRRALEVDRRDRGVQLPHLAGDLLVARQAAPERDQSIREVAARGRGPGRLQVAPLGEQRLALAPLAVDERA